ncbi:MAG: lipid II:glycine glycyltransferase FemX [Acidobacteriota bacterium]
MKLIAQPDALSVYKRRKVFFETPGKITLEVDQVDLNEWESNLEKFEDASLYQTRAYGRYFTGGKNLSHLVLKRNGEVVALSQARILTVPFLQRGMAYIFWGPVWKRKGVLPDKRILSDILRAINNEYVIKRKLMLRIVPGLSDEEYEEIFKNSHYEKNKAYKQQRTIIVNLEGSLPEIRSGFHHKWRNRLNVAERNDLKVLKGTSEDLFLMFRGLYNELLQMKDIPVHADIDNFIRIQEHLREKYKMQIMICTSQGGRGVAGLVASALGSTGICLLAAANKEGRELLGTYLLQWEMIKFMKENGASAYDLGGVDAEDNPGGYRFKSGMGGREVRFLGQYESCWSLSSRIIVNTGEYLRRRKKMF